MAENDTLLAHLVSRYARSSEDAATDALTYILNKSESAASALNSLIKSLVEAEVNDCVRFDTQVAEEGSRFDLVGYDANDKKRVIGESKFWAGLGLGQGKGYLSELPADAPSVLIFVVPEARVDYLWPEVVRDVERSNEGEEEVRLEQFDLKGGMRRAKLIGTDKYLVMVSWRNLLSRVMDRCAADINVASDIRQLIGLTEMEDKAAFQPIRKDELGPEAPRRILGYWNIAESVINRGSAEGLLEIGGFGQWFGGRGRTLIIGGFRCWFGIDLDSWTTRTETPFWFQIQEIDTTLIPGNLFEKYRIVVNRSNTVHLPIIPKTESDQEEVIQDILRQLSRCVQDISAALSDAKP